MDGPQFQREWIGDRPIHIIGAGSLGSKLFQALFRKNVPEIHVWDHDVLEARNLFNQAFFDEDIGKPKVEGLVRIGRAINPRSSTIVVPHAEKVVAGTPLSGIVLSAVDSMRGRYDEIWPCVRENENVTFFGDGRVAMIGGKAYGLNPKNPLHVYCYENEPHKHEDPVDPMPGCKTEFPMPENSDRVAAEMIWRLNQWLMLEQGCADPYVNFIGWIYTPLYGEVCDSWDSEDESDPDE